MNWGIRTLYGDEQPHKARAKHRRNITKTGRNRSLESARSSRGSDIDGKDDAASIRASSVGSRSRELAMMPGILPSMTRVAGKSAETTRTGTVGVGGSEMTMYPFLEQ